MEKILNKASIFESIPETGNARYSEYVREIDERTAGRGVYIIYQDGNLVYVGSSDGRLYQTLTRHFQSWSSDQYRVVFPVRPEDINRYTVDIYRVGSDEILRTVESALILAYDPELNRVKISPIDEVATELVKEAAEEAEEAIEEAKEAIEAVEEAEEIAEKLDEKLDKLADLQVKAEREGEDDIAEAIGAEGEELEERLEEQEALISELEAVANIESAEAVEAVEAIPGVIEGAIPESLQVEETRTAVQIIQQNTKAATALAFAERDRKRRALKEAGIFKPRKR
jgi:hypothetical protein